MTRILLLSAVLLLAAISNAQQIPNGGFEDWESTGKDTIPQGWTTSPFGAGRSSDAVTGSSAISIWNWYSYAEGTLRTTNIPFPQSSEGVFHLLGNYKYVLGQNGGSGHGTDDSAIVILILKKWNAATGFSDTVAIRTAMLGPSANYSHFNIELPYHESADSLEIEFHSSVQGFCTSPDGQCCYLTLDDLQAAITGGVAGIVSIPADPPIPNPFRIETSLGIAPSGGCRMLLSTVDGIDVYQQHFAAGKEMILSGKDLAKGTYVFRLVSEDGIKTGKVIRQ